MMILIASLLAASATPPAATPRATAEDDGSRIVCRSMPSTGTRLGRSRVCRTQAEWDQSQKNSARSVHQSQQRVQNMRDD